MTISELQRIIDEYDYFDSRVKSVECNYFADEVHVIYDDEDGNSICYNFIGCYKSIFDHVKEYGKGIPVKSMTPPQIPYFLQDVRIDETIEGDNHLWICKINMFPLHLEIWCKDIIIENKYK